MKKFQVMNLILSVLLLLTSFIAILPTKSVSAASDNAQLMVEQVSGYKLPWPKSLNKAIQVTGVRTSHVKVNYVPRQAIDFGTTMNTSIVAMKAGDIVTARELGDVGKLIEVDTRDGYCSVYLHLSSFTKKSGPVNQGEEIGKSGELIFRDTSGKRTGSSIHAHIAVYKKSGSNCEGYGEPPKTREVVIIFDEVGRELNYNDLVRSNNEIFIQPCTTSVDQITLYEHDNYTGACKTLGIGNYPSVAATGFANDSLTSIKVGANVQATLAENENYGGINETFYASDPILVGNAVKNDNVSSLKVVQKPSQPCTTSADQITLYEHDNYVGKCKTLGIGNYPSVAATGFANDSLTSIRVGANVQAILAEHENYGGINETLSASDPILVGNAVKNDNVSSLKVVQKTQAGPWVNGKSYTIKSVNAPLVLDIYGGSAVNGAKIAQWEYHGGANQIWKAEYNQTNSYYRLISALAGPGNKKMCMVVQNASSSLGAKIILNECSPSGQYNEWWKPIKTGNNYYIINQKPGMVLYVPPGFEKTWGTQLVQWSWNGSQGQQWTFIQR